MLRSRSEGSVPERAMKRAAEDCAEAIPGVQQVHNRIRVERTSVGGADGFRSSTDPQRSTAGKSSSKASS